MNRRVYSTNIADEWFILEPLLGNSRYGRPLRHGLREMMNAIYYQARTGWLLPHDLSPYTAVCSRFSRWCDDGT
jgi:transposase